MSSTSGSFVNPEILDQLPSQSFWETVDLYKWEEFWYNAEVLQGMLAFQSHYEAHSDDVILASSMKTGTTWLKALCALIMGRQSNVNGDETLAQNPHFVVRSLECDVYKHNSCPDLSPGNYPSPRIFHTHLPYSALPASIKNSNCKIIYIARNPNDTLVSLWHFMNKILRPNQEPYPFEKAYAAFCNGVHHFGPYLDHILQYWSESLKKPNRILFLKYEDLKRDPKGQVKRVASFLGRPFDEESDHEVEKVLGKSSLEGLKNLEVKQNCTLSQVSVPYSSYFRLGIVGDWKNYFREEMKLQLMEITRRKLEGSGLDFET